MAHELNVNVVPSPPIDLDFRWYEEIRSELLRRAVQGAASVLDVGCGAGDVLLSFAPAIGYGLGVDRSLSDIEKAGGKAGVQSVNNVTFVCADAADLPANEGSFRVVLCLGDVLSSSNLYGRWRRVLAEMSRVLALGGTVVFHCMNWAWEYQTSRYWTCFLREPDGSFVFSRVQRAASGRETSRNFAVVTGTPLHDWLSKQEWPVSRTGNRTALTVIEKGPLPKEWVHYRETSRHRNFTADGLAQALRRSGFGEVWVTAFGATYDIAGKAGVLGEVEPVRRRLAQAEAEMVWEQRQGSGPWLFATAQKV
jgi:ubiquinone/menaquinone biosynthesis C-methylase UbiE